MNLICICIYATCYSIIYRLLLRNGVKKSFCTFQPTRNFTLTNNGGGMFGVLPCDCMATLCWCKHCGSTSCPFGKGLKLE